MIDIISLISSYLNNLRDSINLSIMDKFIYNNKDKIYINNVKIRL